MRILYFSDVHIENRMNGARTPWTDAYPLDLGPDLTTFLGKTDLAVLAGDIGTIRPRESVSVLGYAQQVSAFLGCPVVLVPGKHEYYRGRFDADRAALGVAAISRAACPFYWGHKKGPMPRQDPAISTLCSLTRTDRPRASAPHGLRRSDLPTASRSGDSPWRS
jgi:hypothetical protein